MPELPEVETIRRQLEPELTGRTITGVRVLDAKLTAPVTASALKRRLEGSTIESVGRRGKYLLFKLGNGETLVLHLRMTGVLTHVPGGTARKAAAEQRPPRLVLRFDDGASLLFHDTRRFGTAMVLSGEDSGTYWHRLGQEPLERDFNAGSLERSLSGRKRPIKSVLLDQALIAGIGNIYADEALFEARIHPLRPAGEISGDEIAALVKAIKSTLRRAIRLQGSSIDTYRDSLGRRGRFQETFRVHRRQGEPCPGCQGMVEKIKVGGRGTYFCPSCQRL